MSEVPEDLMEVSRDVVKRFLRRYSINDASINSIGFTEYEFARALAAERERATLAERAACAAVAEATAANADRQAMTFDRPSLDFQRWSEGCRQVAKAILARP